MSTGRLLATIVVIFAFGSHRALAQKADADAAFQRGRAHLAAGEIAQACAEFEASMRFDAQLGTLYNLATCHERLGKLATAWTEYKELVATDTNAPRVRDAKRKVAELEPRLTRMRLVVQAAAPGLVVRRDDRDVTSLVGGDYPVDPGTYTFVAEAPGRERATIVAELAGDGATVEVVIPELHEPRAPAAAAADTAYPMTLPQRPLALPRGLVEVSAGGAIGDAASNPQTPFDGFVGARAGFGFAEVQAVVDFHLRYAVTSNRPNEPATIFIAGRYVIAPSFTVGADYTSVQPTGGSGSTTGYDLRALVARKHLLAPTVALDGRAGVLYSQRTNSGGTVDAFAVTTEGRVQVSALGRASFELATRLDANLGGMLYPNTLAFFVTPTALVAITPRVDAFAVAAFAVAPTTPGNVYILGASWRTR
jgi:hypothetical protein